MIIAILMALRNKQNPVSKFNNYMSSCQHDYISRTVGNLLDDPHTNTCQGQIVDKIKITVNTHLTILDPLSYMTLHFLRNMSLSWQQLLYFEIRNYLPIHDLIQFAHGWSPLHNSSLHLFKTISQVIKLLVLVIFNPLTNCEIGIANRKVAQVKIQPDDKRNLSHYPPSSFQVYR